LSIEERERYSAREVVNVGLALQDENRSRGKQMKIVHVAQAIVICTVSNIAFSGSVESAKDCYDSKLTRSWVEYDLAFLGGNSWLEKSVYRRGDRIALGIAHGFTTPEILEPARLDRVLAILRLAFSQPEFISEEQDADPALTIMLLSFLERHQSDPDIKQRILETEKYILMQSKGTSQRR
jgi:hypothetical protein